MKGYPFEVLLPERSRVQGAILCDQVKSLDWRARKAKRIDSISEDLMLEVCARILPLVTPQQ